ncbi:MAG: phospholipase D-like domain-containing protein [Candidatus Helarchaeota archaeon]
MTFDRLKLISFKDGELFEKVILEGLVRAKSSLLIGTYNLQNIRIASKTQKTSLTKVLIGLSRRKVKVLICLAPFMERSQFLQELTNNGTIGEDILIRYCRRMHFKVIIVDLNYAYIGTANLSGAGVGLKSVRRRNFELGFVTEDEELIADVALTFLDIFNGRYCSKEKCYFYKNTYIDDPCFGIK